LRVAYKRRNGDTCGNQRQAAGGVGNVLDSAVWSALRFDQHFNLRSHERPEPRQVYARCNGPNKGPRCIVQRCHRAYEGPTKDGSPVCHPGLFCALIPEPGSHIISIKKEQCRRHLEERFIGRIEKFEILAAAFVGRTLLFRDDKEAGLLHNRVGTVWNCAAHGAILKSGPIRVNDVVRRQHKRPGRENVAKWFVGGSVAVDVFHHTSAVLSCRVENGLDPHTHDPGSAIEKRRDRKVDILLGHSGSAERESKGYRSQSSHCLRPELLIALGCPAFARCPTNVKLVT